MLKRNKNGFIDLLEKHGYSPSQFKTYEKKVDGNPAFIIQLENSPLFFMARTSEESYEDLDVRYIRFAPNYPKSDYQPENGWMGIMRVYEIFEGWLAYDVKSYIEEIDFPDLWDQIEGKHLFSLDPLSRRSGENFDKVEKEKIRSALEHFRKLVEIEYRPGEDQMEILNDRLDYLSESLDRLNKVDWQGITISTVISISVALSLDTDRGKTLFDLFKQAFSSVAKLIGG